MALPAAAQVNLDLYSTGHSSVWYSSTQTQLANGANDTHWSIVSTPSASFTSSASFAPLVTTPHNNWLANNSTSKWLSDISNANNTSSAVGDFVYRTTFTLAGGADPSTVQILFQMASDNSTPQISVNGVSTGLSYNGGYAAMSSTMRLNASNATFKTGTNTIDFTVTNVTGATGNPQGLRVQIVGAALIPEPGTLGLLALGGLALTGRRFGSRTRRLRS